MRNCLAIGLVVAVVLPHSANAASWYYCDSAHAYYPNVSTCPEQWREIPAAPPTNQVSAPTPISPAVPPQRVAPTAEAKPPSLIPADASSAHSQAVDESEAFRQGKSDRQHWEMWLAGQVGDARAGADYWASHRNTPKPGTCNAADNPGVSPEWAAGCTGALQQLAAIDVRRKTEPDYRRGFNTGTTAATIPASIQTAPVPASPSQSIQTTLSPQDPKAVNNGLCKDDWKKCKDNSDLVNNFHKYLYVKVACERETESKARYGTPKWPGFWQGGSFGSYIPGTDYVSTGNVTAIEPDAQFQNEYGAMVHSKVICKYDLAHESVTDIYIIAH